MYFEVLLFIDSEKNKKYVNVWFDNGIIKFKYTHTKLSND